MLRRGNCLLFAFVASTALAATTAVAADAPPDFGDDSSAFANDDECDDMRFEGPGMTSTPLLDEDVGHDATDCRTAFDQGRLTFKGADVAEAVADVADTVRDDLNRIQWGDDSSPFARDGECDDMRFTGPGMTETRLLDTDVKHDATDCRVAYRQGRLSLQE